MNALPVLWREMDTVLLVAILAVGIYLVCAVAGIRVDFVSARAAIGKFLGFSAPVFIAAIAFLAWVAGALAIEVLGFTSALRSWSGIAAMLFYVENVAPFVGLLECFISIVRALLAYSELGASAQAQSVLIANIAVALGASAVGCFVALLAHSLKAVVDYRREGR